MKIGKIKFVGALKYLWGWRVWKREKKNAKCQSDSQYQVRSIFKCDLDPVFHNKN